MNKPCDDDLIKKKPFIENEQYTFQNIERQYDDKLKQEKIRQNNQLLEDKKSFLRKKQKAAQDAANCPEISLPRQRQRFCICPVCAITNVVKDKVAGKNYFKIPFTNFKIPRFDHLFDKIITFDSNRRKGEVCGACGGRKTLVDVTDDSVKYQEAAQKVEDNAQKIMEAEAKLGLGGTRTTVIQGSDLLFVGLGFNNNKTHEVIPGGSIAPSMKGGKIPQQNAIQTNAVVGKQGSLAWPQQVGNYTIKCANKFSLLAGAGGITIATPGPLTISAALTKFVGPQISIGSSTGPLTLEGDSVNVTGKAISITPTGGELFVKGNISNTGNITTQGHAHFESASFTKAACVGTTKSTLPANSNPDVVNTQPATWAFSAAAAAALDIQTYFQHILTDTSTSGFRLLSPKEMQNLADRMTGLAKLSVLTELLPTGYLMPGTPISVAGTCPCNFGGVAGGIVTGSIIAPVPLFNFPHIHGIPEMMHKHEIVLPDIDITSNSPKALRSRMLNGAHESGVPSDPTKDTMSRLMEVKRIAVEFTNSMIVEGTKVTAKIARFIS